MLLDPGQKNLIGKRAWKRQDKEKEKWEFMSAEGEAEPSNDDRETWKDWEKIEHVTEDEALEFAVYIRSRNEEKHPTMTRISFLYSMYEPQCYDFEVKETVRKLLLTGDLIFLRPGSASQIVVSMLMCLGSIRTYAYYNPFVDPKTDIIAEVAQWSLFFIMFGALLIRVNMDSESLQDQGYFDAILVGVNLTPLLLPMIQQLAIMKTLKNVAVLSTVMSTVGSFFGCGGEVIAAQNQIKAHEKNFGVLSAVKEKMGRNDEEAGLELVERQGGGGGAVTLGGGDAPMP
ncbi:hypothetical protein TrVE_jg9019 [Triparma verrucosa]|uniref:Uncharacterized protein n=1 Tax=Triparma verrucosa TaxID=1606542 RepID=A0A9W7FMN9_9STRA|nr:hypothetical protein TrVE_jg9019 [Triparma verrucosa]